MRPFVGVPHDYVAFTSYEELDRGANSPENVRMCPISGPLCFGIIHHQPECIITRACVWAMHILWITKDAKVWLSGNTGVNFHTGCPQ